MTFLKIILLLCISFILSIPCAGAFQAEKVVLDNGLTVLVEEMPSVETISVYTYVKTGSATEGAYLGMGISHFVEHMLFKGTKKRRVGDIAQEVKNLGGLINAQTNFDATVYMLDVPKGHFPQALDIISDMVMNSTFEADELEKEREVIHGEMRLHLDRPQRVLSNLIFKNVYIQHPYRHPTIGYPALFDQITRDDVFNYYKTRYVPNNMIISVAGAVKTQDVLSLIEKTFAFFPPLPYLDRNVPQEQTQVTPRRFTQEYPTTPLYRFSLSYPSVSILDSDLYALDVLAMALGQGKTSRLYQEVYLKKRLVEAISAANFTPQDKGIFIIEAVSSENTVDSTLKAIERIIADVKKRGLSPEELMKTKHQVLSQYIFSNQTTHALAFRNAMDEAMTGDIKFSQQYVEEVKHVTNNDIKRVAKQYLRTQSSNTVVLAPKQKLTPEQTKDPFKASVIQKVVLDNGLTILLKEDPSIKITAIEAVMNAGIRQENPSLNGLSELTARVWTKGTKRMDQNALAKAMENRGGSLTGFAGRNTLGLKIDVLAEDTDFALNVLEDLIKNPTFNSKIIDQERQQLSAAIDHQNDDIAAMSRKELLRTLFLKHPFRLNSLGTKSTLKNISKELVDGYYQRFAKPQNMVISVFGNFDSAKISKTLKNKFGSLKSKPVTIEQYSENPPQKLREKILLMDKEQAMVSFAFQAPSIKSKDRFSMEIIDGVLGSGLSGRLFIKVREHLGNAYTVGSDYVPGIDTGVFSIHVLTTPEKADTVKELVLKEIESLRSTLLSSDELNSVKNYLKGTFKMTLDSPSILAALSTLDELYGLGYDFYTRYDQAIDASSAEDIQRVAREYLDLQKAAVVMTMPKKKIE